MTFKKISLLLILSSIATLLLSGTIFFWLFHNISINRGQISFELQQMETMLNFQQNFRHLALEFEDVVHNTTSAKIDHLNEDIETMVTFVKVQIENEIPGANTKQIKALSANLKQFRTVIHAYMNELDNGQTEDNLARLEKDISNIKQNTMSQHSRALKKSFELVKQNQQGMGNKLQRSRLFVFLVLLLGMGVTVSFVMFLVSKLQKTLSILQSGANHFSQGDLKYRITGMPNDKFGDLASTYNAMAGKLDQQLQDLVIAKDMADQSSKAKSEFLANMSHEIRTPMNGILGMSRLVMDMELGTKQKKLMSNVMYSAESLLGILNDILDFSKIEAGQLSLDVTSFNLQVMLNNIVSTLSFQAEEKGVSLESVMGAESIPEWIKADELRLRQVLVNLVGNAIKFTKKGGVTIKVEVLKESADATRLRFAVQDTGIGISPEKQKVIFSSFTQADGSIAREFGGTGLGLAISKQLIEMMEGTIEIVSAEGQGCESSFIIDVQMGENLHPSVDSTHAHSIAGPLQVLLVEDNKINQDLALIVLENDSHTVALAENGLEALQALATADFDIVLMDIQMPQMDGLIATTIIRNCENGHTGHDAALVDIEVKLAAKLKGRHIPIIAMTANVMDSDRQKCKDAGMDDFLSKPFIPHDLQMIINTFSISAAIQENKSEEKPLPSPVQIETEAADLHQKAFNHLKELFKLDNDQVTRLLSRAVKTLASDLESLRDATEGEDIEKLQKTAHSLKGALLNLGLQELSDQAKRIENISSLTDVDNQKLVHSFIKYLSENKLSSELPAE